MANSSLKERAKNNKRIIANHSKAVLIVNAIWFLYRLVWGWSEFGGTSWLALAFFVVVYYVFFYVLIVSPGRPVYDEQGNLVDGFQDLNTPGLTG